MHITHEEAIQLIQYNADKALHSPKEKILDEHLKDCAQCRAYAHQLSEMEIVLQRITYKQWNQYPAPLSIDTLLKTKHISKGRSTLLVTRTALIAVAFTVFIFIGWQFTFTNIVGNGNFPNLPPIPTPSIIYTTTTDSAVSCKEIRYQVQSNDTLESIALDHNTSKETIMSLNKMNSEAIVPAMELRIPVCDSTPTSTTYPPTFTITPFLEPVTLTPG